MMLNLGKQVLFSGTPCQIAGLLSYLGKPYDNLLLIDIICHGVPSPMVWIKYIASIGSSVKTIRFRDKTYGWKKHSLSINGSPEDITVNPYLKGFIGGYYLRPSCYNCQFKNCHHQSDITLGDFWGVENILPKFSDDRGTSLVLVHSAKGQAAIDGIQSKVRYQGVPFNDALAHNQAYFASAKPNSLRVTFFKVLKRFGITRAFFFATDNHFISRIVRRILRYIESNKKKKRRN